MRPGTQEVGEQFPDGTKRIRALAGKWGAGVWELNENAGIREPVAAGPLHATFASPWYV